MIEDVNRKHKSRIILRKGPRNFAVKTEDIAFFYVEEKIVFAIDAQNNKYICDKNLIELQLLLDEKTFFRANRKYIININFIKAYQSYQRVKLLVELTIPDQKHEIIISQITAPEFKKWILEE